MSEINTGELVFSGLRIAAAYSVVGAVISEWLGGFGGLGVYMTRVKKALAFDKMFAVIFLIAAISLALMALVGFTEKKCMPYRNANKKGARMKVSLMFTQFGLEGTQKKYRAQLSGGMQQRAALLRTYMFSKDVAVCFPELQKPCISRYTVLIVLNLFCYGHIDYQVCKRE